MPTATYTAVAYRQSRDSTAPWIVTFVASAESLLSWAGIPRRTEASLTGFQRLEDDQRISRARDFFKTGPNQSPTALIVGIHPVPPGEQATVTIDFLDEESGTKPRAAEVKVTFNPDNLGLNAIRQRIRAQALHRLQLDSEATAAVEVGAMADETGDDETNRILDEIESELEEEDSSEVEDRDLELGRSQLQALLRNLDDDAWCNANIDALIDLAKPATIIDGQHRVKGAEMCERNIPFTICALFDCSWPEQVFQFTVVNYTAKGIPDQFITANAALSLTESELAALESRLVQARVKVQEYELMRVVQFSNESPFMGLINLSEKSQPHLIGYKTMVRIAKTWYSARPHVLSQYLLPNLFPEITGKGQKARRIARWRDGDIWGQFFCDFWRVAYSKFQGEPSHVGGKTLWDVGASNLMISIVLYELQLSFFRDLNNQDEEYFQVPGGNDPVEHLRQKLTARAERFLDYYPTGYFATSWGAKSLNTSAGRSALEADFRKFYDQKGKYPYNANSKVISGDFS